ncbi:unnamed protein product [Amoebophrya sp. A25]|nr:unnamed protein product [Amoebophrya sp. A25]|eukprot:GSA25T00000679001.1
MPSSHLDSDTSADSIRYTSVSSGGKSYDDRALLVAYYRVRPYQIRSSLARKCVIKLWRGVLILRRVHEENGSPSQQRPRVSSPSSTRMSRTSGAVFRRTALSLRIAFESIAEVIAESRRLRIRGSNLQNCRPASTIPSSSDNYRQGELSYAWLEDSIFPVQEETGVTLGDVFRGRTFDAIPKNDIHWLVFAVRPAAMGAR